MTHPIFRPGPYPFWRAEARTLHRRLADRFTRPADVERLYRSTADGLPGLFLGQAVDLIWQDALEKLAPAGLLPRLTEVLGAEANLGVLAEAIAAVVAAQPLVNENISADDVLVINRENLRTLLGQVGSDAHPTKVVLVRGKPKSGKTHGQHLFELAARDQGAEAVYLSAGMVATVDESVRLLFSIVLGAGEDRIPPRDSTADAWYRAVSFRLIELAKQQGTPVWIAVDDLGLDADGIPLMDEQIRRFFEQLAVQLQNPAARRWFRLMFIHYPDSPPPTGWRRDLAREDRVDENDIGKDDVVALIRRWSIGRDRARLTDEHLDALATEVIAATGAAAPPGELPLPRLQIIHDELVTRLRTLEAADS
jgi:hypothetical protein